VPVLPRGDVTSWTSFPSPAQRCCGMAISPNGMAARVKEAQGAQSANNRQVSLARPSGQGPKNCGVPARTPLLRWKRNKPVGARTPSAGRPPRGGSHARPTLPSTSSGITGRPGKLRQPAFFRMRRRRSAYIRCPVTLKGRQDMAPSRRSFLRLTRPPRSRPLKGCSGAVRTVPGG